MQNQELAETIRFVISEVDRLTDLSQKDWKSAVGQMEISKGMPSESVKFPAEAKRYYRCGKVAERQLYKAVAVPVEADGDLRGRLSAHAVFEAVRIEVVQRCLEQGETITSRLAGEILKAAKAHAAAQTVDRTYFFPVFAIRSDNEDEFSIGAATLTRTKVFFDRHQTEWQQSIASGIATVGDDFASEQVTKNIEWLYSSAEKYYRGFPCIASVHIRGAEPELGRIAAKAILESSFNILRIFTSSTRGQFIGLAEDSPHPTGRPWIERSSTGEFMTWHSGRQGEPHVPSDPVAQLRKRMPQARFFEYIISKQSAWAPLRPIERRLLNALSWFGEAWKERVPVAKLVKFAVALETLLMTGGKEAITETLAERVALLCGADTAEREQLHTQTRQVYRARSKAVHGGTHENPSELYKINATAEQLCVFALFSCASLFPTFIGSGNETEALAEFFKVAKLGGLEEAARRIGAAIHLTPTADELT